MFGSFDSIWLTGLPIAQSAGFWLPDSATTNPVMDRVFNLTLVICSFLFVLVVGLMTLFVVRYRPPAGQASAKIARPQHVARSNLDSHSDCDCLDHFLSGIRCLSQDEDAPAQLLRPAGCRLGSGRGSFIYPNGYIDKELARSGRRAGATDDGLGGRHPRPVDSRSAK